ncbi:MAG TPA: D-lyxose/D-mannose family sugar isomerase [Polyangiaceae bacterium]|jgi:hypothetical protein
MKRSEINQLLRDAEACFIAHGWAVPPNPEWDVTDFGLGDWRRYGLVLINLAQEPEYCEKVMYAKRGMTCPNHCHAKKKEDIICRWGELCVRVWPGRPDRHLGEHFRLSLSGKLSEVAGGDSIRLRAGERVTLCPGTYHEFWSESPECIIGEVSTANDDVGDNFFLDPNVGRFPEVVEDEAPRFRLVSDAP